MLLFTTKPWRPVSGRGHLASQPADHTNTRAHPRTPHSPPHPSGIALSLASFRRARAPAETRRRRLVGRNHRRRCVGGESGAFTPTFLCSSLELLGPSRGCTAGRAWSPSFGPVAGSRGPGGAGRASVRRPPPLGAESLGQRGGRRGEEEEAALAPFCGDEAAGSAGLLLSVSPAGVLAAA